MLQPLGYASLSRRREKTDSRGRGQEGSTMDSLSLPELKQLARQRRIKQYYILKRAQLIHLLSFETLPQSFVVEKMTIHELREEAKRKGFRGFWNLRRERLVELLFPETTEPVVETLSVGDNKLL